MSRQLGSLLVGVGIVLVVLGLLLRGGLLSWFGRLPGDIRIERPGLRLYFPLVSLIVVSVVLNLLLRLWRR